MTSTTTLPIEDVRLRHVIRVRPTGGTNVLTLFVTGTFDGLAITGRRATVHGDTVCTRGRDHAHFIRPGATVEVVR